MVLFFLVFVVSLTINFVFYKADIEFYMRAKHYMNVESVLNTKLTDYSEFHDEILNGILNFIREGNREEFPSTQMFFTERFHKAFSNKKTYPRFFWAEPAWALVAVLEDTSVRSNKNTVSEIAKIFDETTLENAFTNVDQSVSGIAALHLYEITKQKKYLKFSDKMYQWIKSQESEYGILYNQNTDVSIVDALGMVVPFLMEYSKYYDSVEAKNLAIKTIESYVDKGVDSETGFPAFSYRLKEPHIKMGMSNWGRGTSYYVIGLDAINQVCVNDSTQIRISRFNNNVGTMWNETHCFGQFIGEGGKNDLSAELPILYYLYKLGLVKISKQEILEYSKFMHEGIMYNSSSSNNGIVRYGTNIGPNILSQAFMLKLINEVK